MQKLQNIPDVPVRGNFQQELTKLINEFSMEDKCGDVPDWVIAEYLVTHLNTLKGLMESRDGFFNIDVYGKHAKMATAQ